MECTVNQLMNERQYQNFFDTFGYIKIVGVFDSKEVSYLKKLFSNNYEQYFKKNYLRILIDVYVRKKTFMVPSFADENVDLLDILRRKNLFSLAKILLGSGTQYWGSDGSLFGYGSLWHRDVATRGRRLKMNIYPSSGGVFSGAFRIIPGSHKISDEYADQLARACAWPYAANKGGLNENEYFPETVKPSSWQKIFKKKNELPHVVIKFNKGDILLFDDRAIHCVYAPLFPKARKLITVLFCEFPADDRKNIASENIALKKMECSQYSCAPYGKNIQSFFAANGLENMAQKFRDIEYDCDRDYSGQHKDQFDDLKKFLTQNYR
jgi:hypothetical protein